MYTLSRKDIYDFAGKYQDGMLFFMWASADYTAARCCMLNNLRTGYRLASEAIEKLLKAAISFETGVKTRGPNALMHNPYLLKERLKLIKDYGLDAYDTQLKKLADHYVARYHDNIRSGRGSASDELIQIDEIWITIVELMPIPKEVLYNTYFFSRFLDEQPESPHSDYKWITTNNQALIPKINSFLKEHKDVHEYYMRLSN